MRPPESEADVRTLIIGPGVSVKGEITSCNRLIVEGTVEAKLDNGEDVLINEGGLFKGESATENADIHGTFEGDLVVRKRLEGDLQEPCGTLQTLIWSRVRKPSSRCSAR